MLFVFYFLIDSISEIANRSEGKNTLLAQLCDFTDKQAMWLCSIESIVMATLSGLSIYYLLNSKKLISFLFLFLVWTFFFLTLYFENLHRNGC